MMLQTRVIPCLLMKNSGLVKTVCFKDPKYVGDPINAVKIFNEKEVDELILLDIDASKKKNKPNYELIKNIVSEAFMPIAYGGGVKSISQAKKIVSLGVEKIIINSIAIGNYGIISEFANNLGSSSTVVAVDIKKDWAGRYRVYNAANGKTTGLDPLKHVLSAVNAGAGEIFINDVVRDGTGIGYDLELVRKVTEIIDVPVIVCGGAGTLKHFTEAVAAGASAVAAGSMFVYVGKHKAVMINYPERDIIKSIFNDE